MMSASVDALNVLTHELINVAAAGKDTLDNYSTTFDRYLRDLLGLASGRETLLRTNGRMWTAEQWLAEGGEREDDGSPFSATARFYRHFHNPLRPWDEAGLLTRYPLYLSPHQYTSSVRWMQANDQTQDDGGATGGTWAWRDARRLQYLVLTTADARQREAYAADLFRALGQIMHLVVDASVPEHVRNDPHPFGTVSREVLQRRTSGNYEYWVSDEQARLGDDAFAARYLSAPIGPDEGFRGLPSPTGEYVATTPVARLIDTDRYLPDAPDPNVTLSGPIGLAEFAQANFFSEDTLLGDDPQGRRLPFPSRESLVRRTDLAPLSPRVRTYLEKPAGSGLATKFALAECRLEGRAAILPPYPCMDEAVWAETAAYMLPRAVGYARAVLDYFFRGSLGVSVVRMRAGIALIQIYNLTDEEMTGVFEVFGRPDNDASGEGRERTAVVNNGAAATIAAGRSLLLPIAYLQPVEPTPLQLLVFRGRLGLEEDAVAAQTFTVHHLTIAQTAHTADLSETCTVTTQASNFEASKSEIARCSWISIRQQTDGELVTNNPASRIARVSVSAPFEGVELLLDGVRAPSGTWQRQGSESNPSRFSVRWSRPMATVGGGQALPTLTVQLADGMVSTARVYASIVASGEARKGYNNTSGKTDPPWYLSARRSATVQVATPAATGLTSYQVASISGYPNPTHVETDRFGVLTLKDTLDVDDDSYFQRWTDFATVYWTAPERGPVELRESLKKEFDAVSYGPVPMGPLEALFERTYRPEELAFLRTFVRNAPPPTTLTVIGRRPGAE
jgi:hypothetical protein